MLRGFNLHLKASESSTDRDKLTGQWGNYHATAANNAHSFAIAHHSCEQLTISLKVVRLVRVQNVTQRSIPFSEQYALVFD